MNPLRTEKRPPPVWMQINLYHGKCWCGKPQSETDQYCCLDHRWLWYYAIHCDWNSYRHYHLIHSDLTCELCRKPQVYTMLHVSHMTPPDKGGAMFDEANLIILCHACHTKKFISDVRLFKKKIKLDEYQTRLYMWNAMS